MLTGKQLRPAARPVARWPHAAAEAASTASARPRRCATNALPMERAELGEPQLGRRTLLLAAAAAALAAPARAAEQCELVAAASGLSYCDLAVGTGAVPTKGAFVK
jgi:hypothetical protein